MTTYYVDPAAAGANNGTSWGDAWTSLQSAADAAVAGDIVYCRGTQTLGAAIDFDINGGTNAGGMIRFIGCNAAGNVDGTRFLINGNNGAYHLLHFTNAAYSLWFENIEAYDTGVGSYNGWNFSTWDAASGCVFINCCAHDCGGVGFGNGSIQFALFYRCVAYSNTANGFTTVTQTSYMLCCCSRDNTADGFGGGNVIGCIAHGNSDDGSALNFGCLLNSVSDGNTDNGIEITAFTSNLYRPFVIGCRITNHAGSGDFGLYCNSEQVVMGHCYFEQGGDGVNIDPATDDLLYRISLEGGTTDSNEFDGSDTDKGYVDSANHDFSTDYTDATDPTLRRTAITIPWS